MNRMQVCRETLQDMEPESAAAEFSFELADNLDSVDDESLSNTIDYENDEELSPYLLGRLACQQGVNNVQLDPFMMDLLGKDSVTAELRSEMIKEWFDGWSRESAKMSK